MHLKKWGLVHDEICVKISLLAFDLKSTHKIQTLNYSTLPLPLDGSSSGVDSFTINQFEIMESHYMSAY